MMTFGSAIAHTMTNQQPQGASTDAACIATSLDDPAAFRELFARHHSRVHRYVTSRVGPEAAEDVVSETFLQAFRIRARFDASAGTDALPWLMGIATRLIARSRRAEGQWLKRITAAAATAEVQERAHPGDQAAAARLDAYQLRGDLVVALAKLRAAERDAFCACVLAGLTYEEAATALDIPVGSVRSRVSRARSKLAAAIDAARAKRSRG